MLCGECQCKIIANRHGIAYLGVLEEGLDLLVLHLVLNWAEVGAIGRSTDSHGLGEFNHGRKGLLVDVLVDVNTLGSDTNLTGVLESAHDELRSNSLDINIGKNNGSIVTAELESHTLKSVGTGSHDLLAGWDGASERDLGDTRVGRKHWSESVITANSLDNTWWEDALSDLNHLEGGVWGEWRWLNDDSVASQNSGEKLSERENDGEVLETVSMRSSCP